jgi:hypothetical protein
MMCRTVAIVTEEKEIFGQPLIVQAKPGGGGAVGVELVYGAKPDGYTLLAGKANWSIFFHPRWSRGPMRWSKPNQHRLCVPFCAGVPSRRS